MTDNFDKAREGGIPQGGAQGDTRQFLTFTIGSEEYGVDIMTVREIKGWQETTRLPNTPDFMRGVMNLRGLIIPIFDLRMRFCQGATDATLKHVVIILAVGERNIGILVDAVSDILDAPHDQIKPPPQAEAHANAAYISGLISLEERMVVVLDVDHLFGGQAPEHIAEQAA
jgi:purine-binding chemotaxis protein CheW